VIQKRTLAKIQKDLVYALELARNQFAVTIAAESKSTPREQWLHYLDTAERMGRFIKKLRRMGNGEDLRCSDWIYALELLRRIPTHVQARQLHHFLGDLVAKLE